MRKNSLLKKLFIIFVFISVVAHVGCEQSDVSEFKPEIQATNLMKGIFSRQVNTVTLDDQFNIATANFSLDLFKAALSNSENSLISPASVLLALTMAANGADGKTLEQMEQVIGKGLPIAELNAYLYSFVNSLSSQKKEFLNISNSIWFKDWGFTPNHDFLQTNADFFGADAFEAPFDNQTVKDINIWISNATDGLIKEMLDSIPEEAVLYLINTILFDAEWQIIYEENNIRSGHFINHNNQIQTVDFMHSLENLFIQDNGVIGFIKPYFSGRYSFAAILPDNDIFDFVAALTGEGFLDLIGNAKSAQVAAALPKFEYEYKVLMNDALISMGMEDAFSKDDADLSRMGDWIYGNMWISKVIHKTNIAVDVQGTKAGAATVVEVSGPTSAPPPPFYVTLDRPFVFSIIDNTTKLPLFIGTLLSIQ